MDLHSRLTAQQLMEGNFFPPTDPTTTASPTPTTELNQTTSTSSTTATGIYRLLNDPSSLVTPYPLTQRRPPTDTTSTTTTPIPVTLPRQTTTIPLQPEEKQKPTDEPQMQQTTTVQATTTNIPITTTATTTNTAIPTTNMANRPPSRVLSTLSNLFEQYRSKPITTVITTTNDKPITQQLSYTSTTESITTKTVTSTSPMPPLRSNEVQQPTINVTSVTGNNLNPISHLSSHRPSVTQSQQQSHENDHLRSHSPIRMEPFAPPTVMRQPVDPPATTAPTRAPFSSPTATTSTFTRTTPVSSQNNSLPFFAHSRPFSPLSSPTSSPIPPQYQPQYQANGPAVPTTTAAVFVPVTQYAAPIVAPAPTSSQFISQLLQEKDAELAASHTRQQHLTSAVSNLAGEVETLKSQLSQALVERDNATQQIAISTEHALATLREAHALELQALQQQVETHLHSRESQFEAIDQARHQANEAMMASIEQEGRRLEANLEDERQQLLNQIKQKEQNLRDREDQFERLLQRYEKERIEEEKRAEKVLEGKQQDLNDLVAQSQQSYERRLQVLDMAHQQKRQELEEALARKNQELEQRQLSKEEELRQKELQLLKQFEEKNAALTREYEEKESQIISDLHLLKTDLSQQHDVELKKLVERNDSLTEQEQTSYHEIENRKKAFDLEMKDYERTLFQKYQTLEGQLIETYQQKMDGLEEERKSILDRYTAQQHEIDRGNEAKLKEITRSYKDRIKDLETEAEKDQLEKRKLNDQLILQHADFSKKRQELENLVSNYKILQQEHEESHQLLLQENNQLKQELSGIKVTYEELIHKLGEAQSYKVHQALADQEQTKQSNLELMKTLADTKEEVATLRTEQSNLQGQLSGLQLDHTRLLSTVQLVTDSKILFEQENIRLKAENKRQLKEMERLEKIVYGHGAHARGILSAVGIPPPKKSANSTATTSSNQSASSTKPSKSTAASASPYTNQNGHHDYPLTSPFSSTIAAAAATPAAVALASSPFQPPSTSFQQSASIPSVYPNSFTTSVTYPQQVLSTPISRRSPML